MMKNKKTDDICLVPHCEETILLVVRECPFCTEHLTKFDNFLSIHKVPNEIKNMLKIDKEFRNEFFTDMVDYFVAEEEAEYHRKNAPLPIKNNEQNKKT